ncbi:hypothetical protein DICSQDRAFT_167190 [Dichomitus squalens LYAD-421 SS1]|uniref:uncharacterized protein n=1 Tax=Dichomitus squalens (strain LYAD-421) TaxID=732165 RepID=UPI0004410D31|nr:uncharacterized protein DICSQDRAFT_167190 [Dichomitus squalens LYAD-421 SS1]EJF64025.1 hypothetical protein DICSQDRAFT_167190 [Dichomitus squalens LYAD-421 SS1]
MLKETFIELHGLGYAHLSLNEGRDIHENPDLQARTRDLDQIQLIDLDPKTRAKLEAQPLDYEKPGLAQHYCVECANPQTSL